MYIKSLEIENIRSIDSFKMDFKNPAGWHVIIGDNGAGKSTILKGIAICLLGDRYGYEYITENLLKKDKKNGSFEVNVDTNHKLYFKLPKKELKQEPKNIKNIEIDKRTFWSEESSLLALGIGPIRIFDSGIELKEDWKYKKGQYISLLEKVFSFYHIKDWLENTYNISRDEPSSTLTQKEIDTSKTAYEAIKKMVNHWNLIDGVKLSRIASDGIYFIDRNETEIEIMNLSDGYISALIIFFEIIRQMVRLNDFEEVFGTIIKSDEKYISLPGIVLIDEIDSHLHPSWQTKIGQWFTTYFPNIQFIVTTHSPLVCRACEKGSIWRLATPGSDSESGEVSEQVKNALINGDILDAYGTT